MLGLPLRRIVDRDVQVDVDVHVRDEDVAVVSCLSVSVLHI